MVDEKLHFVWWDIYFGEPSGKHSNREIRLEAFVFV